MLQGERELLTAEIRGLRLEPNSYRTFFLVVDPHPFSTVSLAGHYPDGRKPGAIIGGLSVRLEPFSPQQESSRQENP